VIIDCDSCAARGPACADCVVTVLLSAPDVGAGGSAGRRPQLEEEERAALGVLADSGLVPPLRLIVDRRATG
jgi:hypothetical protein